MSKNDEVKINIPLNEMRISFARSSGAGGQNVNKTSTKATIHWCVGSSDTLNLNEKELVREKLVNRINNEDELVVYSEQERSQSQNRELAISQLNSLVRDALRIPKKRYKTRPTMASKKKRIESKKIRSKLKANRRIGSELTID